MQKTPPKKPSPVFLFKWVGPLTVHTFSLGADVERMLLKGEAAAAPVPKHVLGF